MSKKDNSVPLLPFEIERQARIKRSLTIRLYESIPLRDAISHSQ
jgi:hypothetical protein